MPQFFESRNPARDRTELFTEEQVPRARAAGSTDGREPYLWTTDYGHWDRVDLEVPPGTSTHWSGHVLRINPARTAVVVDLWTAQEGPSDLSLEMIVDTSGPEPRVVFEDLHVR